MDYGKLGFTLRSKVVPSHRPALSLPLQTEINNPLHKAAVKIKLGYRYKARIRMIGTREELRNDELLPPPPSDEIDGHSGRKNSRIWTDFKITCEFLLK